MPTPQEIALEKRRRALEGADANAASGGGGIGAPSAGLAKPGSGATAFERSANPSPVRIGRDRNDLPAKPIGPALERKVGALANAVSSRVGAAVQSIPESSFANTQSGFARPGGVSFNDPSKTVKPIGKQLGIPSPSLPTIKEGDFGRGLGSGLAVGADMVMSAPKMLVDGANRAAVGVRNIAADAVGAKNVEPVSFNYRRAQDALANVRARNAAGGAVPVAAGATPAPVNIPYEGNTPRPAPAATSTQSGRPGPRPAETPVVANTFTTSSGRVAPAVPGVTTTQDVAGNNVYSATGASVADAQRTAAGNPAAAGNNFGGNQANDVGSYGAAAAAARRVEPVPYAAPGTGLNGNLPAAEAERQKALSQINSDMTALGSLNSRGKRSIYEKLLDNRNALTRDAYGQQGDLAKTGAGLNVSGQNAALDANAARERANAELDAQVGEGAANRRQQLELSGEMVEGANGRQYVRRGTSVTPVTGADGKGFEGADVARKGDLTPKDALDALIAQQGTLDQFSDPDGSQRAAVAEQIQALFAGGKGAETKGAVPPVGTVKNGYRFVGGNPNDKAAWEKVQ